MSVGDDVKGVLEEVGTAFTNLRDSSTGYLDYESNTQVTKPFIREYFLEAMFSYDTDVIAGDVIEFDVDGRIFIVMNKTPENFENAAVDQNAVLYKCNVSGELKRPVDSFVEGFYYETQTAWTTIDSQCYALWTEKLFGTMMVDDEELGQIGIEKHELYVPRSVGAKVLDRYEPRSGEFYRIDAIEKEKFDSVDICHLVVDTRV